ncbi:MAG TPA: hypothetical protein VGM93_01995 [Acidimicrobiales bacterium]
MTARFAKKAVPATVGPIQAGSTQYAATPPAIITSSSRKCSFA